jgi:hypothetical protein
MSGAVGASGRCHGPSARAAFAVAHPVCRRTLTCSHKDQELKEEK